MVLYEILFGSLPFANNEDDVFRIYEAILKGSVNFSPFVKVRHIVKDLIRSLLNKKPAARLKGGVKNLKLNLWFADF